MRAISFFSFEAGISTVSLLARAPLRSRVRKSATGSVMLIASPARLRHAGDVAVVRELAQADPAHAELAEHGAGAAAAAAARVLARLVLGRARLAHPLRGLRHFRFLLGGRGLGGARRRPPPPSERHAERLEEG